MNFALSGLLSPYMSMKVYIQHSKTEHAFINLSLLNVKNAFHCHGEKFQDQAALEGQDRCYQALH